MNYVQRTPSIKKYWDKCDPNYSDGKNAESFVDFCQRIKACLDKIDSLDCERVFIFTHGHVMRHILLFILTKNITGSLSKMRLFRHMRFFPIPNTSILEIDWDTKAISPLQIIIPAQ